MTVQHCVIAGQLNQACPRHLYLCTVMNHYVAKYNYIEFYTFSFQISSSFFNRMGMVQLAFTWEDDGHHFR